MNTKNKKHLFDTNVLRLSACIYGIHFKTTIWQLREMSQIDLFR
jgi:hypothetical protein